MGEIRTIVHLENRDDKALSEAGYLPAKKVRHIKIDVLVDTGAVMILLPQEVVEKLGLKVFDKRVVLLANETTIEMKRAGYFMVKVCGREMVSDCLVGPPLSEPLIGQIVLENLDLVLNPGRKTITVNPASPLVPHLKMK